MNPKVEKVLRELEAIPSRHELFWNVPRTTGEFLGFMVRVMGARAAGRGVKVLEIGTSNGYSGLYIADALAQKQGVNRRGILYTVESNKERYEMARENFSRAGVSEFVRQILGHAPEVFVRGVAGGEAAKKIGGDFDLIFLDATKMEYESYADAVLPLLRAGGVMIADNCVSHTDEVRGFVAFLESRADLQNILLPFDNGLMLSLKMGAGGVI